MQGLCEVSRCTVSPEPVAAKHSDWWLPCPATLSAVTTELHHLAPVHLDSAKLIQAAHIDVMSCSVGGNTLGLRGGPVQRCGCEVNLYDATPSPASAQARSLLVQIDSVQSDIHHLTATQQFARHPFALCSYKNKVVPEK